LSYSADGKVLYLSVLTLNSLQDTNTQNQQAVVSCISKDNGKHWSAPSFLYTSQEYLSEPDGIFPAPDKNSVTADPNIAQNAYVVYDSFVPAYPFHSDTYFNKTIDGGTTWSPNRIIYDPFPDLVNTGLSNNEYNDCQTINNVVVVQPKTSLLTPKTNGDLLNFMVRLYAKPGASDLDYMQDSWPYQYTNFDIACVRSSDQGETWNPTAAIVTSFRDSPVYTGGYTYSGGQPSGGIGLLMRTGDIIPSYNVNPKNGNLYVAYQTGEFTPNQLALIGLKASYDGGYTWTNSALVSQTPLDAPNPQAFAPFVAVTENGYVGILYNDFRKNSTSFSPETKVDAWLAIYRETGDPTGGSTGIGLDFVKEVRLSKHSYIAENGPTTSQGIMTNGDYSFLTARHSTFYAIFTMSKCGPFSPPVTLMNDPSSSTVLLLDDNYRSAPFARTVKP